MTRYFIVHVGAAKFKEVKKKRAYDCSRLVGSVTARSNFLSLSDCRKWHVDTRLHAQVNIIVHLQKGGVREEGRGDRQVDRQTGSQGDRHTQY